LQCEAFALKKSKTKTTITCGKQHTKKQKQQSTCAKEKQTKKPK